MLGRGVYKKLIKEAVEQVGLPENSTSEISLKTISSRLRAGNIHGYSGSFIASDLRWLS
jgi:hypothetical protein